MLPGTDPQPQLVAPPGPPPAVAAPFRPHGTAQRVTDVLAAQTEMQPRPLIEVFIEM